MSLQTRDKQIYKSQTIKIIQINGSTENKFLISQSFIADLKGKKENIKTASKIFAVCEIVKVFGSTFISHINMCSRT